MSRYTKFILPSGYIDICFDGKPILSVHPDAGAPNERLAEWLRECLSTGLGSCTLELAAPKMLEALLTNRDRAEWAREALEAYKADEGPLDEHNLFERASDLVCDLLHLMRREAGLDTEEKREDWLAQQLIMNRTEITEDEEG